ncbi:DUF92 domain-containing protein [Neobacillus jeddahensis]|uniref:DUF92 domain-containing protein n=1 Tax=Neobacillus jeddahensis TaxID=1461580 RepID=UPI000AE58753|nr:DUF92 domain-containing protein [Neobacillus jeddahensis]
MMLDDVLIFGGIVVIGVLGYHVKSLSKSGSIAAIIVGMAVFIGFGVKGLILLGSFFASSSLWSNYKSSRKKEIEEKLAKGARRDWRQVFANGGAAVFFSVLHYFYGGWMPLIGFMVTLASANSDTWASEIGSLSRRNPLYIRTFRRIEKGTSGAISFLGSSAALIGSLFISLIGGWLFHLDSTVTILIFLFGFIGNVIDTLMGAFYQQEYICKNCGLMTEKKIHCHLETTRIKGFTFVDNDMVNFLSGFMAAIFSILIIQIIG